MEILIFTLNAIVVYLFSDWLLRRIEQGRGQVLKHRQIIFFVIFLTLAMTTFTLLRRLFS